MKGSDPIRDLMCGRPSRRWNDILLVMLHAYIDDSFTQANLADSSKTGRRLYLAGYVGDANSWMDFQESWDDVLQRHPPIEYFKMSEAHAQRKQFENIPKPLRDQKLHEFADVIRASPIFGVHVSVDIDEYKKRVAPYAPYPMQSEYFPLFFRLIHMVLEKVSQLGERKTVDFIFDSSEDLPYKILPSFNAMMWSFPESWKQLLVGLPKFENDIGLPPLQAADMLAWHIRRKYEGNYPSEYQGIIAKIILNNPHYFYHFDNDKLDDLAAAVSDIPMNRLIDKSVWKDMIGIDQDIWQEMIERAHKKDAEPD